MTEPIRTVVFDFDGTLHNCLIVYEKALQTAWDGLAEEGLVKPRTFTSEEAAGNIGLPFVEAWGRMAPQLTEEQWAPAAAHVGQEMLRLVNNGTAQLYPGVPEMLQDVHDLGFNLVFLSNCKVDYRDAVRRAFGLDRWFEDYFAAEAYGFLPKAEIFTRYVQTAYPGRYVFVGDHYKDIEAAFATGMPSIGCLYGFGTQEELANATALAASPAEITPLLERMR